MLFFSNFNKNFLKRKGSSLLSNSPPFYCNGDKLNTKERAPYAAFKLKGSLTVEASLVLPLFIAAIVALLFFIQAVRINVHIQKAVYNQTMRVAGYAYYVNVANPPVAVENILEAEYIKYSIINELGTEFMNNPYMVNNQNAFSLNFTNILDEGIIDVALQYKLKVPFDILGVGEVPFVARARCKTWAGADTDKTEWDTEMVYVTKYGEVYHNNKSCTFIKSDVKRCSKAKAVTLVNESGERYKPCSLCSEGHASYVVPVYYTKYGNRFHVNENCGNLKSNVFSIEKDNAVKKYRPCSKCAKEDKEDKESK